MSGGNGVGNSQNLQFVQQGITLQSGSIAALAGKQICVNRYSIENGTGGAADIGLGISLPTASVKIATKVGSVYTSKSAPIGSTVLFTTTNNDGVIIYGKRQFGFVGFFGPSAATGSPAFSFSYYNGSSFTALTTNQTTAFGNIGANTFSFNPPVDWALGDGGLTTNSSYYAIQVLATTAPGSPYTALAMNLARWITYTYAVAAGARSTADFATRPLLLEVGEGIFPYISTANAKNAVEVLYQIGG